MDKFLGEALKSGLNIIENFPLARVTTIRIGGPARYYCPVHNVHDLTRAATLAHRFNLPFKVIGKGSNLLVADAGFQGLIIHNQYTAFNVEPLTVEGQLPPLPDYLSNREKSDYHPVLVRVSSGYRLPSLLPKLHGKQIVGLEYFAGIPATTGGAIYMNAHGGPYFFGQFVNSVRLFDGQRLKEVKTDYFNFAYDYSILQETKEIVLDATFVLWQGDVAPAKKFLAIWARKKKIQPQKSAGCIFQNLTPEEQKRLNLPTLSVGYFIDRLLHLKGFRRGEAIISTAHAAFIENLGQASASDVLFLIDLIRNRALEEFNIELKLEIELLGFESFNQTPEGEKIG